MNVLHKCDRGNCVNIEHLYLGTQCDNVHDMEDRGRSLHPVGEWNGLSKLTEAKVRAMRWVRQCGLSFQKIGKMFGVNKATARHACQGTTWTHVEDF